MIEQSYIQMASYGAIIIFLLLQWFMSVRPWFIWGLILPLLFGAAWYCVAKQPLFFDQLGFTPDIVDLLSGYCKLGIIASLILFAICRVARFLRRRYKAKSSQKRVEQKRRRQREEALAATQVAQARNAAVGAAVAAVEAAQAGEAAQAETAETAGH